MDAMRVRRMLFSFALALAGTALSALAPAPVLGQGLTYTLSPSARWVEWDESVAFDRTRLLGGAVDLGFGRYVGLTGFYHRDKGVETRLSGLGLARVSGDPVEDQKTDIEQMGGALTLSLGTGSIVPILTGGGGLLRFRPEDGDKSTQLTLDAGAGLKLVFGESLSGQVVVEKSTYRMDRYRLARGYAVGDPDFPTDPNADQLLSNLSLRVGLGLQLGRRNMDRVSELDDAFAQRYQAPFSGFALSVEPLAGQMRFAGSTGLERQDMIGLRAGFDFGSFFGLRGFYWQGTESDLHTTQGMTAWGGEGQFALSAGPGLNPYMALGAGRMQWKDDFREDPVLIPADQTSLILGGGVDFNFGPRVRATVGARDFILSGADLSAAQKLDAASSPDDLVHNWQYSAGLKFVVGGGGVRSSRPAAPAAPPAPTTVAQAPAAQAPAVPAAAAPVAPGVPATSGGVAAPAAIAATPRVDTVVVVRPDTADAVGARRTMLIPIPEKGEIYIRFGDVSGQPVLSRRISAADSTQPADSLRPAGSTLTDEMLREIVRQELARAPTDTASTAADRRVAELQELEARIEARMRELAAMETARTGAAPVIQVPVETQVIRDPTERSVRELRPFTGLDLSGQAQLLLGAAADIGPLKPGSSLRLMPTLAVGYGQGPGTLFMSLGMEYRLPVMLQKDKFDFQPLFSVGPSLFKRDSYEAAITTQFGGSARIRAADGREKMNVFAAFQGVNLFSQGRFLVGLRRLR